MLPVNMKDKAVAAIHVLVRTCVGDDVDTPAYEGDASSSVSAGVAQLQQQAV